MNLSNLLIENIGCIRKDVTENNVNIVNEAIHAPTIPVKWYFIDVKDGLIVPKASFVVAVEPTMDPTLPILLINAGYITYISRLLPATSLIFPRREPVTLTTKVTNKRVKSVSFIVLAKVRSLVSLNKMYNTKHRKTKSKSPIK